MECFICKEKFNVLCCYYCCLKYTCSSCYNKITSCPFCRSKAWNSGDDYYKFYKLVNYINTNKDKNNYIYHTLISLLIFKIKNYNLALYYALQSTNKYICYDLAVCYLSLNKKDEAIPYLEKSIEIFGSNDEYLMVNILNIYYEKNKKEDFIRIFNLYKLSDKNENNYYCFKGSLAYLENDKKEALLNYLISDCKCCNRIVNMYKIYKEKGNYREAEKIILNSNDKNLISKYSIKKRFDNFFEDEKNNKKLKLIEELLDEKK